MVIPPVKHKDFKEACEECVRMELNYGKPFSPYRCPHCGGWHVAVERSLME